MGMVKNNQQHTPFYDKKTCGEEIGGSERKDPLLDERGKLNKKWITEGKEIKTMDSLDWSP